MIFLIILGSLVTKCIEKNFLRIFANSVNRPEEVVEEEHKQETDKKISITVTAPVKRNSGILL